MTDFVVVSARVLDEWCDTGPDWAFVSRNWLVGQLKLAHKVLVETPPDITGVVLGGGTYWSEESALEVAGLLTAEQWGTLQANQENQEGSVLSLSTEALDAVEEVRVDCEEIQVYRHGWYPTGHLKNTSMSVEGTMVRWDDSEAVLGVDLPEPKEI